MKHQVIFEPIEVDNALLDMGLDKESLLEAVKFAASEKAFCTDNDPLGFASMVYYAKTARRLREIYCVGSKSEWIKDNKHNQAAIRNSINGIRIVPCNFDEFAGKKDYIPTNKSPKGEVSRRKAVCNSTGWLPGLPNIYMLDNNGEQTWILGIYVTETGAIQAELSLPVGFEDSQYTAFSKRIMLSDGNEPLNKQIHTSEDDSVGIVDIQIKRK